MMDQITHGPMVPSWNWTIPTRLTAFPHTAPGRSLFANLSPPDRFCRQFRWVLLVQYLSTAKHIQPRFMWMDNGYVSISTHTIGFMVCVVNSSMNAMVSFSGS